MKGTVEVFTVYIRHRVLPESGTTAAAPWWCLFLVLVSLILASSKTWAHEILADGDPHNNWIQGLANSENVPCCGNNDCYPLPAGALQISPDGVFKVEISGDWFTVPERNLLRDRSPDGRPWVCPKQEPTAG